MGRCKVSLLLILVSSLVLTISQASAQSDRIVIAAGTDEDHALQAITTEQDAQKKIGDV